MSPTPIATYEEIKDIQNHPEKLLIDVREPDELKGGKIPTSINIPCKHYTFNFYYLILGKFLREQNSF